MRRRNFLKTISSAAAGAAVVPQGVSAMAAAAPGNNKIYEAFDAGMVSGTAANPANVKANIVKGAVDSIVRKMGNNSDLGLAWQALFPGIKKTDKIGIKVNCLVPKTSPQVCTLEAIVNGMKSMFGGTYPAANISLFDNDFALWGFKASHVDDAFGKTKLNAMGIWHGRDTYKGPGISIAGKTCYVSTQWHQAKYCVNFLNPRPHILFAGFLSAHIKNMMGAVSPNKSKFDTLRGSSGGEFHDKVNFKGYADMLVNANIGPKTNLYISDFVFVPKAENAYWDKVAKTIAFGTNAVSIDSYCVDVIKKHYPAQKTNKKVPQALAARGGGSVAYSKVTVKVDTSAPAPTRTDADKSIYGTKKGTTTPQATQTKINDYIAQ